MSDTNPSSTEDARPIWIFRGLMVGDHAERLLDSLCEAGRVERWGHGARIPVWNESDDVIVVVDGGVLADRAGGSDVTRLTRGDAFGKTLQKRSDGRQALAPDHVTAQQETTISVISRDDLDEIWSSAGPRIVRAGRWPSKQEVEVPALPLLGALPTSRMARILLHLVETYGEVDANKGRLPLTLRLRQFAELGGLNRRRAIQVWKLFESAGLVRVEGRSLLLLDIAELRRYALG